MTGKNHFAVRLSMYDWPEVREATQHLETSLQDAISEALGLNQSDIQAWPENMDLLAAWSHPDVLLTQTCGYPLTHALKGRVRLIGAPHYAFSGCIGPRYCSQLVVRKDSRFDELEDLRGARAVFNGTDSQSGMNTFRRSVADIAGGKPFFSEIKVSGGHLLSMRSVAQDKADIASIDAVCWGLVCNELPELSERLRPIAQTASAPGLPFVTSLRISDAEADLIAEVIEAVFSSTETQKSRERLGIRGFSKLSLKDYAGILLMEQEAREMGYPELA
ncbi:phosphate/phosphite/phosphonate ABC transporters, periplasmic binding protein [Roseibium album]|nr:phosphate/phosphite/phosphonate ABC transporters, periplasmic binding protein [Roseibium album]